MSALTNYPQDVSNVKYQPTANQHVQKTWQGTSPHFVPHPVTVSGLIIWHFLRQMNGLSVKEEVIYPAVGFLVLPPQLRGEVAASQTPVRKFKVRAHTVFLRCRGRGLVQLACCGWRLTALPMHPTVLWTKEHSHQTSLRGTADDLAIGV